MGPSDLKLWLARVCEVSCSLRTCEYWLRNPWSSGNALLTIEAAEAEVAARLTRLSSTGCEHPNPRCKLRSGS